MTAHRLLDRLNEVDLVRRLGRVRRISSTRIEADGPSVPLGALCDVETRGTDEAGRPRSLLAEVVAVETSSIVLAPLDNSLSTFSGARVTARTKPDLAPVGDAFCGRAIDALARPIDGLGPIPAWRFEPLAGAPTTPLDRTTPRRVLETGVRAIDALLTLGQGQRVGVFAASGVGKTSLMLELARHVDADKCVVCLIGERGREVEAFWDHDLPEEARPRTTLIAATSDQPAALRARAVYQALALAEYWRRQGQHVLLLLDSVTRLAMALREIGLAAGEPPTVRAYTPGVFAAIPRVVERCGALRAGGAISAIMTILSETDDVDDPISELMKSLLDGHIVLSRALAEQAHFPAIDVPRSVSRLASGLRSPAHQAAAQSAVRLLSTYESSKTLIEAGVYVPGANLEIDRSLERRPALLDFLRQRQGERTAFQAGCDGLAAAVGELTP